MPSLRRFAFYFVYTAATSTPGRASKSQSSAAVYEKKGHFVLSLLLVFQKIRRKAGIVEQQVVVKISGCRCGGRERLVCDKDENAKKNERFAYR